MAADDVVVRIRTIKERLPDAARQAVLERVALIAIGRIQQRTESGRDVDGNAFAGYSAAYAKLREASGRDAGVVSLHLTGQMLASIKILRSSPQEVVIGFEGESESASFRRVRTPKGTPSSRKAAGGGRVTHRLARSGGAGRAVANAIKALGLQTGPKPRRFFGLSDDDRKALVAEAARTIKLVK